MITHKFLTVLRPLLLLLTVFGGAVAQPKKSLATPATVTLPSRDNALADPAGPFGHAFPIAVASPPEPAPVPEPPAAVQPELTVTPDPTSDTPADTPSGSPPGPVQQAIAAIMAKLPVDPQVGLGLLLFGNLLLTLGMLSVWHHARRTLAETRHLVSAAQRARLRIREISAAEIMAGQQPRAAIRVTNIGEAAAHITALGVDIFIRPKGLQRATGFDATPKPQANAATILPGHETQLDFVSDKMPINGLMLSAIQSGELEVCILGALRYEDQHGISRSTNFFGVLNIDEQRFLPPSKPDEFSEHEFED